MPDSHRQARMEVERARRLKVKSKPIIRREAAARELLEREHYEHLTQKHYITQVAAIAVHERYQALIKDFPSDIYAPVGNGLVTELSDWAKSSGGNAKEILKTLFQLARLWNEKAKRVSIGSEVTNIRHTAGVIRILLNDSKYNPARSLGDFDKWPFWRLPAMLDAYAKYVETASKTNASMREYEAAVITLLRFHVRSNRMPHSLFVKILRKYGLTIKPAALKKKLQRHPRNA